MDLTTFIQYHQQHQSLSAIEEGFEKSSFVEQINDLTNFVKLLITAYTSDESIDEILHNQLQSGGVAGTKAIKPESSKKQSFCTEFNQMITNILGLLGFEFSKYLFVLIGVKRILMREILAISESNNYEDVLVHMLYIRNILSLGEFDDTPTDTPNELPFDIDEQFYNEFDTNEQIDSNEQTKTYDELELKTRKNNFFDHLIEDIKFAIKKESILPFEKDKQNWVYMLNRLIECLYLNTYTISTIDALIINLGSYNVAYDNSFIKMFDILYDESAVQFNNFQIKPYVKIIKN